MADRRRPFSLGYQLTLLVPLGAVWAIGLVVLAAVRVQDRAPLRDLFLEPESIATLPWYAGILSNAIVVLWVASGVGALVGGYAARAGGRPGAARFLITGGLVALLLAVDDLFRVHSVVAPRVLGVSKPAATALIGLVCGLWVLASLSELSRTRWQTLAAGGLALAVSVLVDRVGGFGSATADLLVEDGAKLLGAQAVTLYWVLTVRNVVRSVVGTRVPAATSAAA